MYNIAGESLSDAAVKKKFILDFLKKADIGIDDLGTVEITNENLPDNIEEEAKKETFIVSSRTQYDSNLKPVGQSNFLFAQELEGTKKCLS